MTSEQKVFFHLRLFELSVRRPRVWWALVDVRLRRLLKYLEQVETIGEVDDEVMALIHAARSRVLGALYYHLTQIKRFLQELHYTGALTLTSSGDVRQTDGALPVRYTHLLQLADCRKWVKVPDPSLVKDQPVLVTVGEALLMDVFLPRRRTEFYRTFQAQRMGGNLMMVRNLPVLLAPKALSLTTLDFFLRPYGLIVVSNPRYFGEVQAVVVLPKRFVGARVHTFECNWGSVGRRLA